MNPLILAAALRIREIVTTIKGEPSSYVGDLELIVRQWLHEHAADLPEEE